MVTTVLGSAVAMVTATVVNVALPALASDLGASSAQQQWVVNAYLLTLASLILVGGTLGDRFGRRRLYRIGMAVFALASVACAAAPTVEALIALRLVQGAGAALLTPGSLAIIEAVIQPDDRGRAIGAWSGLTGVAAAIGPLLGGLLVEASWRWVFLISVPLAALVWVLARGVPESSDPDPDAPATVDGAGAVLTVAALGGLSFVLVQWPRGWNGTLAVALVVTVLALLGLALVEPRRAEPMVPIDLFANRTFVGANLATLLIYAGLGIVLLMLSIELQVAAGWSPLEAGASLLPVTVIMLLLSPRAGALVDRVGPRLPLTIGPLVMAGGLLGMRGIGPDARFVTDVLPPVIVFALGLSASVAPVTSAALGSAPDRRSGAASGVNNAVARTGQLLAVAAIPPLVGLSGDALSDPAAVNGGFPDVMVVAAVLVAAGAVAAFTLLDPSPTRRRADEVSR